MSLIRITDKAKTIKQREGVKPKEMFCGHTAGKILIKSQFETFETFIETSVKMCSNSQLCE